MLNAQKDQHLESNLPFINVSGYRFVSLTPEQLRERRLALLDAARAQSLKGTILLSEEGINLFLSGHRDEIDAFKNYLDTFAEFADLWLKESPSAEQPFTRLLVRLKTEVIAMGKPEIVPEQHTVPHLPPETFKSWYDSGKDMLVLDTRNDYEVALGTFEGAVDLDIASFRDFPEAATYLPESAKDKPVVTFCTGGIRCEKAGEWLARQGFKEVYQLEGGILNYFEQCGGSHYDGECFVFDKRVAVDATLKETQTRQCYACRHPLLPEEQEASGQCPHCHQHSAGKRHQAHQIKSRVSPEVSTSDTAPSIA